MTQSPGLCRLSYKVYEKHLFRQTLFCRYYVGYALSLNVDCGGVRDEAKKKSEWEAIVLLEQHMHWFC